MSKRKTIVAPDRFPDTPRDLPMPKYRYQKDNAEPSACDAPSKRSRDAANLLRGANLMGCAAASWPN